MIFPAMILVFLDFDLIPITNVEIIYFVIDIIIYFLVASSDAGRCRDP